VTSDSGDEKERSAILSNIAAELKETAGKSRKSLFRKRLKKVCYRLGYFAVFSLCTLLLSLLLGCVWKMLEINRNASRRK